MPVVPAAPTASGTRIVAGISAETGCLARFCVSLQLEVAFGSVLCCTVVCHVELDCTINFLAYVSIRLSRYVHDLQPTRSRAGNLKPYRDSGIELLHYTSLAFLILDNASQRVNKTASSLTQEQQRLNLIFL